MKLSEYKYFLDYSNFQPKIQSSHTYNLLDPAERKLYFNAKAGEEIEILREYLKNNTFIAYMLGPKMAGKSSYTNLMKEIFGADTFGQVIVGDLVREADEDYRANGTNSEIYKYTKENYRGVLSLEQIFEDLLGRSTSNLRPTDFILMLVKRKIAQMGKKSLFIDGFPRNVDQISYSLYFRDLIDFRDDPDLFVLINLPLTVIETRIKERRYCPKCKASWNLLLGPTTIVEYDEKTKEFFMRCDNPECEPVKMIRKEGDEKGIEIIADRIMADMEMMEMARKMHGIRRVELFNSLEKDQANKYYDDYEMTKMFTYKVKDGVVQKVCSDYEFQEGEKIYFSLTQAPVVVQLIKGLVKELGLK